MGVLSPGSPQTGCLCLLGRGFDRAESGLPLDLNSAGAGLRAGPGPSALLHARHAAVGDGWLRAALPGGLPARCVRTASRLLALPYSAVTAKL